jgi:hypothetical protein
MDRAGDISPDYSPILGRTEVENLMLGGFYEDRPMSELRAVAARR